MESQSSQSITNRNSIHSHMFMGASIELVRQCEAFVGHFGSETTHMYFNAMCLTHAGTTGLCPPVADLNYINSKKNYQ